MTDLEGGDDNVGRVDSDGNGSGVGLLNVDSVDVDNPLLSVDLPCQLCTVKNNQQGYTPG
jgi:hypothetical protein